MGGMHISSNVLFIRGYFLYSFNKLICASIRRVDSPVPGRNGYGFETWWCPLKFKFWMGL